MLYKHTHTHTYTHTYRYIHTHTDNALDIMSAVSIDHESRGQE